MKNPVSSAAAATSAAVGRHAVLRYALLSLAALPLTVFFPVVGGIYSSSLVAFFGYKGAKHLYQHHHPSSSVSSPSSSAAAPSPSDGRQAAGNSKESKVVVPAGKRTGNALVDALVDRLHSSGIHVSTDWTFASNILATLPEKYSHLKDGKTAVHGFVYQGVIYINPSEASPSVPIHEYTHIWAEALRQKNPKEWEHLVGLLRQDTALWDSIRLSYPHLQTDDQIADEVLATYSGRRGAERLASYCDDGQSPKQVFKGTLAALERFWKHVAIFFKMSYKSVDDIADRVLSDMLRGVNPDKYIDPNTVTLNDSMPLTNQDVQERTTISFREDGFSPLVGEEAKKVFEEILESERLSPTLSFPAHTGAYGYFHDGDRFVSFDNRLKMCCVEEFKSQEHAESWLRNASPLAAKADEHQGVTDEIILTKDSFHDLCFTDGGLVLPPCVSFDDNGEYAVEMSFHDGYAFDLHPEKDNSERVALYYPTLEEVKGNANLSAAVKEYTGREDITPYDIALKFGQASSLRCPYYRMQDARAACVARATDPVARSFSSEQRRAITLAADSMGCDEGSSERAAFFRELWQDSVCHLNIHEDWKKDVYDELSDLNSGVVRDNAAGLRR